MHGDPATQTALANVYTKYVCSGMNVAAGDVAVLAGAGACIDVLAVCLAEAGECAIVGAPGYRGFERLLLGRARVGCRFAYTDGPDSRPGRVTVECLEEAYGDGVGVRFALVTSPDNPTGYVYSREELEGMIAWARERGLHMVFDEVYAMSVHDSDVTFVSALDVADGAEDVHVVWSASKDLCVSGARFGAVISKNALLMQCVCSNLAYFSSVSRVTQWQIRHVLKHSFLDTYIPENRVRLRKGYDACVRWLREIDVQYVEARAGFFVWCDMSRWAGEGKDGEMGLWNRLFEERVLLTPASECFGRRYGWFRVCFAAVEEDVLDIAFERIRAVLNEIDAERGR